MDEYSLADSVYAFERMAGREEDGAREEEFSEALPDNTISGLGRPDLWDGEYIHLYHTTRAENLPRILNEGLKPRNETGMPNIWEDGLESLDDRVYFSTVKIYGSGLVKVRVRRDQLLPDEDFLGRMITFDRTWHGVPRELIDFQPLWSHSLSLFGTVAHLGAIPPSQVLGARVMVNAPAQKLLTFFKDSWHPLPVLRRIQHHLDSMLETGDSQLSKIENTILNRMLKVGRKNPAVGNYAWDCDMLMKTGGEEGMVAVHDKDIIWKWLESLDGFAEWDRRINSAKAALMLDASKMLKSHLGDRCRYEWSQQETED